MKNRYLYLFKIGYLCSVFVHQADVLLHHAFEQRATINKLSKPALSTGLYQHRTLKNLPLLVTVSYTPAVITKLNP